jgi:hypothetical protein
MEELPLLTDCTSVFEMTHRRKVSGNVEADTGAILFA